MDAILMRSLPVADPESLVVMNWHIPGSEWKSVMEGMSGNTYEDGAGFTGGIFPFPALELFQKNTALFSSLFWHYPSWEIRRANIAVRGQAEIAHGWFVSGNFFSALGVVPAAGRLIAPDDDRPGAPPVAFVSYAFAQKRFGSASNAPGQPIQIDNLPFTVAGVASPEFFGVDPAQTPDVYLPVHTGELLGASHQFGFNSSAYLDPRYFWLHLMGRLRPGVTAAQAQAVLAPQFHQWVSSLAKNDAVRANLPELIVKPGAAGLETLRREYSKPLFVLLAMVGLILALTCANVANLMLARSEARRREFAVRMSVGAGRFRIVRQLLTESVLLALLSGALGILFGIWGIRFLKLLLAGGRADFTLRADLNWQVLAAAAALSLLTGMLFGLAPALGSVKSDVLPSLKETRLGQLGAHRRFSLSRALIVGQIAVSLLLLVGAGLFTQTLSNLHSINLGFNREHVLLFQLDARKAGHKDPEISTFYGDLRRRFLAIPGVRDASLSQDSLVEAGTGYTLAVAGSPQNPHNRILPVGPEFFRTMQIPLLTGRDFEERDRPGSPTVAVINEVFARTNLNGRNPIGQHLIMSLDGRAARDMEIIGVAKDSCYGGLTGKLPPVAYMPYNQGFPEPDAMVYALRTSGDPMAYVSSVREIVRQVDARVPMFDARSQITDIDRTISQEITFADLCTEFAALALIIACVGLYGTMSYSIARRTSEIGIRMALGAKRGRVIWMVLRDVVLLAVAGLAISIPAALAASKLVQSLLFGIKPNDPTALVLAAAILAIAVLAAGYVPARRASRIDPMAALRHE
jgi:predicted permease